MEESKLSEETKKKLTDKPNFNILYIGDSFSRLSFLRGDSVLKAFSIFYEKYANTTLFTANQQRLHTLSERDLETINVLWLDNSNDPLAAKKINDLQIKLMDDVEPTWKETLSKLKAESEEKAIEYVKELKEKRAAKLRVIYCIDEFVWDAPVGRSQTVQSVHIVEDYLGIADNIIVPTGEMKEALQHFDFCNKHTDITVIPSTVYHEFFPLYKKVERDGSITATSLPKAKLLIKGLTIPANVQEFISMSYKDFDITVSSVGDLNTSIMDLIARQKVTHLHHWANPGSNKRNFSVTHAMERDIKFDFMIYCMPESLEGNFYELTMGDEDVLCAIASGILPICGVEHVGYENTHLYNASGLVFGKDTKQEDIKKIIRSNYYDFQKWNTAFAKCRIYMENRVTTSPFIMGAYFGVLLGRKNTEERVKVMEAAKKEEQSKVLAESTVNAVNSGLTSNEPKLEVDVSNSDNLTK